MLPSPRPASPPGIPDNERSRAGTRFPAGPVPDADGLPGQMTAAGPAEERGYGARSWTVKWRRGGRQSCP